MTRAWRRRTACESQDDPLGWLLRITHNEALRILKGRTQRSEREIMSPLEPSRTPSDDPIDVLLADLAAQDMLDCLRPDERVLIHLRYRHDLSQAEVARRLDLPEGTVKVRLHRIRARLRNAWREDNQT